MSLSDLSSRWRRFSLAVLLLILIVLFLGSGWTPPGPAGNVLRHNQVHDIDASPLFYSEVEHITDLQKSLAQRRDSMQADTLVSDSGLPQ